VLNDPRAFCYLIIISCWTRHCFSLELSTDKKGNTMKGGRSQHIAWTIEQNNDTSPALTINSFSDSSLDIGLTAATPTDFASIDIDLGDIVNLAAFGSGPVSGTFAASATGNAKVVIINGHLQGSDSTALSIDVAASLPAEHATIHLHLTDDLHFTLTGTGYVGATITQTSESGGSAQTFSQTGSAPASASDYDDGTFDLAKFVTSVVNTTSFAVQFIASAPGESIHGEATAVLKVNATADFPGAFGIQQHLVFNETKPSYFAFSDTSSAAHVPNLVMVSST
jgi:hypothetical protein